MDRLDDADNETSRRTTAGLVVAVSFALVAGLAGCTVSTASDCSEDDDCAAGQACLEGGGIFARDGICVDRDAGADQSTDADLDAGTDDAGDDAADGTGDVGDDADGTDAGDDAGGDGDAGSEECEPEAVCESYCYEKYERCMEDNCFDGAASSSYPGYEHDLCMEGMGDDDGLFEGCVDRASTGEEACEEIEDEIADYADQSCDSDVQHYRQCHELKLLRTEIGEDVHDACGCQASSTAQTCSEDDDCNDFGEGYCIDGDTQGVCSAECSRFDEPPSPILPDPSCAPDQGMCVLFEADGWELEGPPGLTGMCSQYCTGVDDCPDGAGCMPVATLEDDDGQPTGSLGICSREIYWDFVPVCSSDTDCPGTHPCREGTCQPACDGDDDCQGTGTCGGGGFCQPEFVTPFGF